MSLCRRMTIACTTALVLAATTASLATARPESSATTARATADPIKIAVMADRTGALAFFGQRAQQGWDLALQSIHAKIAGRPVQYLDVQCSSPADCAADTDRVIREDGAQVVMGTPGSALALAISQAAARDGVVYFETAALANALLPAGDAQYIFRAAPDETRFQKAVKLAILGWKKKTGANLATTRAVLVNESSAANHNAGVIQRSLLTLMGIKIVDQFEYVSSSTDFASLAAKIVADKPDVVVETSYVADSIALNTELAQRGFHPGLHVIAGAPSPNDQVKALGADYLNGIVQITYPSLDLKEKGAHGITQFAKLFQSKFGAAPDSPYALTYYSSARILFDVIAAAKGQTSPDALRKGFLSLKRPEGSYANGWGALFNKHGQNTRALAMVVQWQNGAVCTAMPLASASCALRF